MGTEKVQKVLKSLGLTEKEAELYIFLAKHDALRSGEIAKSIRTHRVEVYRMLKSLQTKGVIEATLEAPKRFTAVPLETVLDSFIKAKREETAAMEDTKQNVLNEWKNISKIEPQAAIEKFVVVEGDKKIYSKILQMIKETKSQLSVITSISGWARADQFGVLDAAFKHPLKNKIKLRFLTELSNENMKTMKAYLKNVLKSGICFKGRNPDLGLKLSPRMAIRDKEECLFFIRPTTEIPATGQEDVCLWTNCKTLVQSFSAVFEDLWTNSADINEKIAELEAGIPTPTALVIDEIDNTPKTYDEVISSTQKEIMIITSSEGLLESLKRKTQLRELTERDISVKVMAPLTKENWHAVQELSQYCSVRHAPTGYLESTLVDGKHLIQSKTQPPHDGKRERIPYFGTFITNDLEYVKKTKNIAR